MSEEIKDETQNVGTTMTNAQWEVWTKGALTSFLVANNLQKVTADDGAGKKATVKIDANGNIKVTYTSQELI